MLTSLFGDLGPNRDTAGKHPGTDGKPDEGFAATAIMETVATAVNARGQMVDRHSRDLVVTGSCAQAMREHFNSTRADLETASRVITLLDPAGVWASAVVKALSDAGGRPIERLHLREQTTLRTLAMIERTMLVRRDEDTLRIYHADVRAPGRDNAEIQFALMERSQMTTVIIGPLQPHAIDALLLELHDATAQATWRCPNLLFMLPPSAVWIANKIGSVAWPSRLHVHVLSEPMISASSVWNAMLGMWNHVKSQPGWDPVERPALQDVQEFPLKVSELASPAPAVTPPGAGSRALDVDRARVALASMLMLDGLLGCALVDATTGLVLARESRENDPLDLELAAAACTQVLRAQRVAARNMGLTEPIEEVLTIAGMRQQVMRTLSRHPELFLFALLDKQGTNLALARFKLMEVERDLS